MNQSPTLGALTVSQFCENFRVSRTTLYEQIKQGKLSARKVGHKTLILQAEADRWSQALPKFGRA